MQDTRRRDFLHDKVVLEDAVARLTVMKKAITVIYCLLLCMSLCYGNIV